MLLELLSRVHDVEEQNVNAVEVSDEVIVDGMVEFQAGL